MNGKISSAAVLGLCLVLGLSSLGWLLGGSLVRFRALERTVTVKGLSEQEQPADVAIWPLQFVVAAQQLSRFDIQPRNR